MRHSPPLVRRSVSIPKTPQRTRIGVWSGWRWRIPSALARIWSTLCVSTRATLRREDVRQALVAAGKSEIGMRIGINALYLIPGDPGTEIYLASLLAALARIDHRNKYFIFINRETAADPPLHLSRSLSTGPLRGESGQPALPHTLGADGTSVCRSPACAIKTVLFWRPGYHAGVLPLQSADRISRTCQLNSIQSFTDQFDLPFWNLLLWASALRSVSLIAVSQATANDLVLLSRRHHWEPAVVPHGVDAGVAPMAHRRAIRANAANGEWIWMPEIPAHGLHAAPA